MQWWKEYKKKFAEKLLKLLHYLFYSKWGNVSIKDFHAMSVLQEELRFHLGFVRLESENANGNARITFELRHYLFIHLWK